MALGAGARRARAPAPSANLGLGKTQALDHRGRDRRSRARRRARRSRRLTRGGPRACTTSASAAFWSTETSRGRATTSTRRPFVARAIRNARSWPAQAASVLCVALYNDRGDGTRRSRALTRSSRSWTRGGASYFEYHLRFDPRARSDWRETSIASSCWPTLRRAVEVARSAKDLQALIPMLCAVAFVATGAR